MELKVMPRGVGVALSYEKTRIHSMELKGRALTLFTALIISFLSNPFNGIERLLDVLVEALL